MEKIDFVILWVDGSDIEWLKEKNKYSKDKSDIYNSANRYRDWNILKYWFRGVEKYASWVNNIYFVTWGHIPKWLNIDNPKLKIVKHTDFIPSKYLPTFSSHTIELNLHRIKGLSEKFVYFNDDVFIVNPVKSTDYFRNDKPVSNFYESSLMPTYPNSFSKVCFNNTAILNNEFNKKEFYKKNFLKIINHKNGFKHSIQSLLMIPYPLFSGFGVFHGSSTMLKNTYNVLWDKYYDIFNNTCLNKFRNYDTDINQYIIKDYQHLTGNFELKNNNFLKLLSVEKLKDLDLLNRYINNRKIKEICINDDLDKENNIDEYIKITQKIFKEKLPNKSSFEK